MSMSRQVTLIAAACGLFFQAAAHFRIVDPVVENTNDAVTADQTTVNSDLKHFQEAISRRAEGEARKKEEKAAAMQRKEEGAGHVKEELEKRQEGEKARQEHLMEVMEHRDAAQKERLEKLRAAKEEQARMQSRHDETVADIKDEREQLMQEQMDRRAQALREKQERAAQKKIQIEHRHQEYLEAQARAEERRARSKMEFEVQAKILSDARALREEVEQLPSPATRGRKADKGTLGNMTAMVQAFSSIGNDDRQRRQWRAIAYNRLQPQIARYVVGMRYLVGKLVNDSATEEEDEFMHSLEDFMNDTKDLLDLHQEQARTFAQTLEAAMSRSSRKGLEPIMSLVATEESPFTAEAAPLGNASKKATCKMLTSFMASASPYYMNLEKAYQALNATAQLLPQRLNKTVHAEKSKEVAIAMVELAYAETLGLREASYEVASKLGPLLSTRFLCDFSAAAPVGGILGAALAVALHLLI